MGLKNCLRWRSLGLILLSSYWVFGLSNNALAGPYPSANLKPSSQELLARRMYRVFVDGDSQLLLAQIKTIVPDAFRNNDRNGRSVIQAGAFDREDDAEYRVRKLEDIGIRARVESSSTISRYATPSRENTSSYGGTGYYVVIPAPNRELKAIQEQVQRLALRENQSDPGIRWRDQPRGSHLIVGPFENREIAERWNVYLKDFGLDNARVYYGS